jgi:allophanate hydrolase
VTGPAQERVARAYARIAEVDRPEIWISLRPEAEALAEAAAVDDAVAAGADLPLAGTVTAVKDNIDVAGIPTTAGCPAYSYQPEGDATVVARLRAAGSVIIGKTNLDQFATGLVGTRSPYGAVRDAVRPEYVSGGSSSGSAVAVALGIADLALATDTAGSGRVPAAYQRIVGLKPTRGLVSLTGVVPAARSLDCVSVFASELATAVALSRLLAAADPTDPFSRTWPADTPLGAPAHPRVGIAGAEQLRILTPEAMSAYESWAKELERAGAVLVPVDVSALLSAARLLYGGSFVAARYAAVGAFIDAHPDDVDPTVGAIIGAARTLPAHDLITDQDRVADLARQCADLFTTIDALALPTAPQQPTIGEVAADPVGTNAKLGTFTNFCNLLDLCALAVPAGGADGGAFGVTLFGPAFHDAVISDIAAMLDDGPPPVGLAPDGIELAVFGAHLTAQPLNAQLDGGRLLRTIETEPCYRMYALATTPPKPGLVAVSEGGGVITGELWALPPDRLARLLERLPAPMALGPVRVAGVGTRVGFLCQPDAIEGARDITDFGSWPAFLATG